MKSITIHGVDEPLEKLIKSRAEADGLSINKTIKRLLEESLGVKPRAKDTYKKDFESFCGIWNEKDLAEFNKNTEELRQIDPEDWK